MIYGYCRISRKTQSIDRQVRNICAKYENAKIIKEAFTGTKVEGRKEFNKLLNTVLPGDTIVFDSVSRMSRNAEEGWAIYEELFNKGVNIEFLKESFINTEMYKNRLENINIPNVEMEALNPLLDGLRQTLILLAKDQFKEAFKQAEKEVTDLHQRTKEGIETARRNGKQIGQPKGTKLTTKKSKEAKKVILQHSKDFGGSLSNKDTMKLCGISNKTYYKYLNELKEEKGVI